MELFFGIVLLILAAGMVVLFAMVGELASRVGDPTPKRSPEVRPLAEARIGHSPVDWPESLSALRSADRAVLVVLSTVCGSCRELAPGVAAAADSTGRAPLGVVVTCGAAESGAEFVAGYGLDLLPHHIDVDGRWVREEFNVQSSPVGLIIAGGVVRAALLFNDVATLLDQGIRMLDDHSYEEEVMQ